MRRRLAVIVMFLVAGACVANAVQAQNQQSLDAVLRIIPPDAQAAVVIPSLNAMSDDITHMLEGMDRADLLMGARPLDQLKSATGLNVGINDLGGAAVVYFGREQPEPVFLVPVTNAEDFLQGNFTAGENGSYIAPAGTVVYAKTLQEHVAISPNQEAVTRYQPGDGISQALRGELGDRGQALLTSGEIIVFARAGAAQEFLQFMAPAVPLDVDVQDIQGVAGSLIEQFQAGIAVIDFDPLAVVLRSHSTFKPDSQLGRMLTDGANATGGLTRLPNKPFYVAGSLDIAGMGGADTLRALGEALGVGQLPEWALQSRSVQFAAYPSQAGLAAGLLNDAVLVLQTHQPDQAKAFFREQVLAAGQEEGPVKRLVRWDENRNVAGIGAVDAFEVRVTDFPPEMFEAQMVSQLLFGRTGLRGFVYQAEDALVMTFSQQPAVLQAAVQAATAGDEAAAAEQNNLASMPAIRTMRNWMPPGRDAEFYLDIGQFSLLMQQFAESMGMADQAQVFQFDPSLPPIGFGADAVAHGIQTATIVPSGVLAGILDQLMQMQQWQEHQQPAVMQPTMR